MSRWRALIIDDEALARHNLALALGEHPEWLCVDACANTDDARATMAHRRVDLVLLDMDLPRHSALVFAAELAQRVSPPLLIVVSVHERSARHGMQIGALDCLLKPLDTARLLQALARAAHTLLANHMAMSKPVRLNASLGQAESHTRPDHLQVVCNGRKQRLPVADILWIGAARNYVRIQLLDRAVRHRASLAHMELLLPRDQFMRIHRKTLVRTEAIAAFSPATGLGSGVRGGVETGRGDQVHLHSGETLPLGPSFRPRVQLFLKTNARPMASAMRRAPLEFPAPGRHRHPHLD